MKYGESLPEKFNVPSSTLFWMRKDLYDNNPFDKVIVSDGDVVMDCGSCIGTFAAAVLEAGASKVFCYEPEPRNASVLSANLVHYGDRAVVIEAALVADDADAATLHLSGFTGAHGVTDKRKPHKSITVKTRNFRKELLFRRPAVVKLDVEGSEYELLNSLKPRDLKSVRCMFIEFHPHADREGQVYRIRNYLVSEGLLVIKERLRAFTCMRRMT